MSFSEDDLILTYEEQVSRYKAARHRMYAAGKPSSSPKPQPAIAGSLEPISELAWMRHELTRVRQELADVKDKLMETRQKFAMFENRWNSETPETVRLIMGLITLTANIAQVDATNVLSRRRAFAKARHSSMFLARRFTIASLPEIGRVFGGVFGAMDHTSVAYGIRKVELVVKRIGKPAENTPEAWARYLLSHDWPRVEYKGGGLRETGVNSMIYS
jgi:hypothetical protein